MFGKRKVEEVETKVVEANEEMRPDIRKESPVISDKTKKELLELVKAINEKYAHYFTAEEAVGVPVGVSDSIKISLLLAIYDELRTIRLNG